MLWLLRIVLVGRAAASMSLVGLALVPDISLRTAGYARVASLSVVLWLCLFPWAYRQSLGMAICVGRHSPLISLAPLAPLLVVFALFDVR